MKNTKKTLAERIEDIKKIQIDNFKELIETAKIEDFKHTKDGKMLKVMKLNSYIGDFKAFNDYVKRNGIAYYSSLARGFVVMNLGKVQRTGTVISSLYSPDTLATFSNGSLF